MSATPLLDATSWPLYSIALLLALLATLGVLVAVVYALAHREQLRMQWAQRQMQSMLTTPLRTHDGCTQADTRTIKPSAAHNPCGKGMCRARTDGADTACPGHLGQPHIPQPTPETRSQRGAPATLRLGRISHLPRRPLP